MKSKEWSETLDPWLRPEYAPAYRAAADWLLPRCRTAEERALAPALLLLLAPLNALAGPCRPVAASRVNLQVPRRRQTERGPERVRLTIRATASRQGERATAEPVAQEGTGPSSATDEEDSPPELWLDAATLIAQPLNSAARALTALLEARDQQATEA